MSSPDKTQADVLNNDYTDVPSMPDESSSNGRRRRRRSRGRFAKLFRRLKKRFSWRIFFITVFVIVVVTVFSISVLIADASSQLTSSWESLNRVLNTVSNRSGTELTLSDFNRLESSLTEVSDRLRSTENRLQYIAPLASLNPNTEATVQSLEAAQSLTTSAQNMLRGLQPALTFIVAGEEEGTVATRISSGERVVELLEIGRGRFLAAENALDQASSQLEIIELTSLSPDLLLNIEQLTDYHAQLESINSLLLTTPDLLNTMMGLGEERSYLILAQNNDEIRPSGGFISTYGWFTVRNGRITDYDYSPSTANSPNPPAEDFANSLNIPDWWLNYRNPVYAAWDGSWHADFPQTAQLAMEYYNAGGNPQTPVDGVIAIDITGFELILGALGEIYMPEYDVTVRQENFRDVVYDIRAFGEGVTPHKQFVSDVYRQIFEEWQNINQEETPEITGAVLEALQQKHIMVYFPTDEANDAMELLGWGGNQEPATDYDYLMVVDANLGNKSNNSVIRHLTYDVQIDSDSTLNSRASIRYDYFADVALEDPAVDEEFHGPLDYRSLIQVFVPPDAELLNSSNFGNVEIIQQPAHMLYASRINVEYDTGERYQLTYETTDGVDTIGEYQRYRLLIQKQPGARTQTANVTITLPETANVITTTPDVAASYNLERPVLDFRLEVDADQWIEVIYR